jgi:hypothetical protein
MFVSVKVESTVIIGTVVKYNQVASQWESATSITNELIGVVKSAPDENNIAQVQFAGVSWAIASRDIPDEGGFLNVENGAVYVTSSLTEYGLISPNASNQMIPVDRSAGSLVMVNLR